MKDDIFYGIFIKKKSFTLIKTEKRLKKNIRDADPNNSPDHTHIFKPFI